MLDGDRVGQEASGYLDAEERGDLALLGDAERLGARKSQALALELVPDRRQLPSEQLWHQAERLVHGPPLGDVHRRNAGDPGELGERYRGLHESPVGQYRSDRPAARGRL